MRRVMITVTFGAECSNEQAIEDFDEFTTNLCRVTKATPYTVVGGTTVASVPQVGEQICYTTKVQRVLVIAELEACLENTDIDTQPNQWWALSNFLDDIAGDTARNKCK